MKDGKVAPGYHGDNPVPGTGTQNDAQAWAGRARPYIGAERSPSGQY